MEHDVASLLKRAEALLAKRSDSPRLDAEVLLSHVTNKPRSAFRAWPDAEVSPTDASAFQSLVARRNRGEPVAYLTGWKEFWSLPLRVTPDTLIPRPETELLVEVALQKIPPDARPRVLDLGTGSGAVALALARERPRCDITASDVSAAALAVARANARRLQLDSIGWVASDWFEAIDTRFDVIVSNPPYVAETDPHLMTDGVAHEPRAALAAGEDGLDALRAIVNQAPGHLETGGWLILEHDPDQAERVKALLARAGFEECRCHKDLAGRPRVMEARGG